MAVSKTVKQVEQEANDRVMNTVAWRCAFYRANPQRFVEDYLDIHLKWFQAIIIWAMFHNSYLIYLASRGLGKSFMIAIYCVSRCILYPGTEIAISSKTRKQSGEILDKIENILLPRSALLRAEIKPKGLSNNLVDGSLSFRNGSLIKVVAANENSRHNRAHVVVLDEFRMIDPDIIAQVLKKFLIVPRWPGYLDKPEYKDYPTEPLQEIYASSCWYESSWAFKKSQGYCVNMMDPKRDYFICALPYQTAIREGLLSRNQVENEMSEADFSELSFRMEMEALWLGSGDDSLFKFEDIEKCRQNNYPWLPNGHAETVTGKQVHIPVKQPDEKRIMSVDIALMASKKRDNDAASIFINSNTPARGNRTQRLSTIVYTENMEGVRSDDLALRVRKLFDQYACDYLVIDAKGNGLPIVDLLMAEIIDRETGIVYPALGCLNNDEIAERCADKSAPKVIWAMMGNERLNSDCAITLRESFRNGSLRLLRSEYGVDEILEKVPGYSKLSPEQKNVFKMPYIHTTLLVNELVNLQTEQKLSTGTIKVKEKSGMRKDRYSSLSYNIYVAKEVERQLAKPKNDMATMAQMISFKAPIIC